MSAPNGNDKIDGVGPFFGHGIGVAMALVMVGVALAFAFVASGGAIFGMSIRPTDATNNQSSPNGAGGDNLGNVTLTETSSLSDKQRVSPSTSLNTSSIGNNTEFVPATANQTTQKPANSLTQDEQQLLSISKIQWDLLVQRYLDSNLHTVDTVKQNITSQEPAIQQGGESPSVTDNAGVTSDSTIITSQDNDYYEHLLDKAKLPSNNDTSDSGTDTKVVKDTDSPTKTKKHTIHDSGGSKDESKDQLKESDSQTSSLSNTDEQNLTGINVDLNTTTTNNDTSSQVGISVGTDSTNSSSTNSTGS